MPGTVILFDGPIGVGKTSLGRNVAARLGLAFIDGDDHSGPGPWVGSILTTSRNIVAACLHQLGTSPGVIVAYPLRCTNWVFYRESFRRRGLSCRCVGLIADIAHITARQRLLSAEEVKRSAEMIAQGYGRRPFSDIIVLTDEGNFADTSGRLVREVRDFLT